MRTASQIGDESPFHSLRSPPNSSFHAADCSEEGKDSTSQILSATRTLCANCC
jgi:hypothetical protein